MGAEARQPPVRRGELLRSSAVMKICSLVRAAGLRDFCSRFMLLQDAVFNFTDFEQRCIEIRPSAVLQPISTVGDFISNAKNRKGLNDAGDARHQKREWSDRKDRRNATGQLLSNRIHNQKERRPMTHRRKERKELYGAEQRLAISI